MNPMAFSQSSIEDVTVAANGPDLFVSWISTAPTGSTFQVYLDRRLAWYGVSQRCHLPIPAAGIGRNIWVEVGTIDTDETTHDFSSSLIAPGGRTERAQLSWYGGSYLDSTGQDDIQGFQIYQSPMPGTSVSMSIAVDTVIAYPGGWINDGFGKGGFGGGGFGRAVTLYEWQSGPLGSGVWQYVVVPFDKAGNTQGVGQSVSITINAAPSPPSIGSNGTRMMSAYAGPLNPQFTLNWLASPSE